MAGLVDAREGQVALLADLAARVGGVGVDGGVAGFGEGLRGGVGDCEGDEFAAVPVLRFFSARVLRGLGEIFSSYSSKFRTYQLQA